ncbi:hypothetical protein Vadar_011504 [Vaccinium darrowii]|uniref:Uncharacterized protein n=1 Tax=Vaccinium darrowii TaxID=229202 RepID=A0ACB7Z404_9ERIC|nr:hypothetical protein Vadar_011504 [Vaccinium darrowii]
MKTLLLSSNSFGGPLLLPSLPVRTLLELEISNNNLEGFTSYKIASSFPSLKIFNMFTNNFGGNIPSSFGDQNGLTFLDLSNNRLSGEIPVHLAIGCHRLEFLKLSNNNLKGPILPHQNNLTQLHTLYSDHNGFTEIPPNLTLSPLRWLDASANQLVGKIPGFIRNTSLFLLAMAGNHLEGPIPIEFCELKRLWWLDLSENYITGGVPSCFNPPALSIRLSKNRLHGPFPRAFQNTSLRELDLSYNQFSGNIPTWIGSLSDLTVLLLQNNQFEGNIPKELCHLSYLTLIDLSSNNLSGSIIPCISNVKFNGTPGVRVWGTGIDYSPSKFTSLLHDVRTKDEEIEHDMFISDTVAPEETGPIPPEIGNLTHIKVLNFSHNYLTGTIPATFSNLKSIECLDFSYNNLSGKIPSQLTELYSLAVFNLSYNNLSGSTPPTVAQFGTFDQSNSYVGNPLLCGEPLPRKCDAPYSPPQTLSAAINGSEEDFDFMDMDTFYMSFAGSYITVVLAIVAILFINPYWRRAWFHLLEVFLTSSYYFVVDNLVYPVRGYLWK